MTRSHRAAAATLALLLTIGLLQAGHAQTPGVVVPAAGDPNLTVASVRLENGARLSKVIGSGVYIDANTTIGSVEDLIMTKDDKVVMAILSVGGFVGLGSKLVAVPFDQLQPGQDGKTMLPGMTKDKLNSLPNFGY